MLPLQRFLSLLKDHHSSVHMQHDFANRVETWERIETAKVHSRFPSANRTLCQRLGVANAKRMAILANTFAAGADNRTMSGILSRRTRTMNEYWKYGPTGSLAGFADTALQGSMAEAGGSDDIHASLGDDDDIRVECLICYKTGIRRGIEYR